MRLPASADFLCHAVMTHQLLCLPVEGLADSIFLLRLSWKKALQ